MSKRRLTQRQLRQVQALQAKRLSRVRAAQQPTETTGTALGPEQEGLVITRYGASAAVEDAQGVLHHCVVRPNLDIVVCGDRVVWQRSGEREGVIVACMPRRSLLSRPDYSGRMKPLAANIDEIVILAAPEPELSEGLIDRYLVASETIGITPVILVNKIDLLDAAGRAELEERLRPYRDIGYRTLLASVRLEHGLDALIEQLNSRTSILVGQSGVGKSSLIKALLPDQDIRIGELSRATGLGTHTTTRTTLYHLPGGGDLIDSPGVRSFGLWNVTPADVARGFVEFRPYLGACRFNDCRHRVEPGCALQEAASEGKIHPRRLASYHSIVDSLRPMEKA